MNDMAKFLEVLRATLHDAVDVAMEEATSALGRGPGELDGNKVNKNLRRGRVQDAAGKATIAEREPAQATALDVANDPRDGAPGSGPASQPSLANDPLVLRPLAIFRAARKRKAGEGPRMLLAWAREHGGEFQAEQVMTATGLARGTVATAVSRLLESGELRRVSRGTYCVGGVKGPEVIPAVVVRLPAPESAGERAEEETPQEASAFVDDYEARKAALGLTVKRNEA